MLSRRNIRVKVMQTLYAEEAENNMPDPKTSEKHLLLKIEQSRSLFTYLLYFLTETALFAERDAATRAGKYLPSASDLAVNTKIAGNELVWQIKEDSHFKKAVDNLRLAHVIDYEQVKRIYLNLAASEEYAAYIESGQRQKKSEKKILEFIFTQLMLPDELFTAHVEENYINWDDDGEGMQVIVMNYLNKPLPDAFTSILSVEKMDFAKSLLRTVIEKQEVTLELIKPKLKNWDADRIAALDLILLQMGVCEFLFFETIPTKVTINEYIDLAKAYSTPQSGQFVNGLLDNIHKELTASGKIQKKVFKNSSI